MKITLSLLGVSIFVTKIALASGTTDSDVKLIADPLLVNKFISSIIVESDTYHIVSQGDSSQVWQCDNGNCSIKLDDTNLKFRINNMVEAESNSFYMGTPGASQVWQLSGSNVKNMNAPVISGSVGKMIYQNGILYAKVNTGNVLVYKGNKWNSLIELPKETILDDILIADDGGVIAVSYVYNTKEHKPSNSIISKYVKNKWQTLVSIPSTYGNATCIVSNDSNSYIVGTSTGKVLNYNRSSKQLSLIQDFSTNSRFSNIGDIVKLSDGSLAVNIYTFIVDKSTNSTKEENTLWYFSNNSWKKSAFEYPISMMSVFESQLIVGGTKGGVWSLSNKY